MKLKMISSSDISPSRVNSKDQIADALKTLSTKQNREYLQKTTQLNWQENSFVFDSNHKSQLSSLIADPEAPASLRQAAHYLVYKTSSFESLKASDTSFSFE